MKPREIAAAVSESAHQCAQGTAAPADHALVALRSLVADFTLALERAGKEATQWMSIDQVQILNQLYLAVGK
ncbi:MAG TPA: hypothetical protein VLE97_06505 [Gaiellaceae bacterium]|nr:hypothetical protein [Gaiellaceae bacterium]